MSAPGRRRPAAVALALLALAALPGPDRPRLAAAATIRLSAREFTFTPREATAPPGEATFAVANEGAIEHDFVLEDASRKTAAQIPVLEPGQTLEVAATLRPGTYVFYCSLPGHREAGMAGTLTVR